MARKSTIVLVLACVFVFALASSAYAVVGDSGFVWNATRGDNGITGTPHIGFSTTTYKCGVCHTVHGAPVTGQILLDSTVAGACEACHLNAASTIKQVYQSTPANWATDTRANHSATSGLTCTKCHGVHGAWTVKAAGWSSYILSANTDISGLNGTAGGQGMPNGDLATGGSAAAVLSNYCTQCHGYYTAAYDSGIAETFSSHVMTDSAGLYANPVASTAAKTTAVVAATADSYYCTSCHDIAGLGSAVSSATASTIGFPHNVPLVDRFMKVAAYSGASATSATLSADNTTTKDAQSDGACIKCHMWNSGNNGAGVDF